MAPDVKWDEHAAIREIDAALEEIHNARMDAGMPAAEPPGVENKAVYSDRLREATKLLDDAGHDLAQREDSAWAKADRQRAIDHLKNAQKAIKEAAADREQDARGHKH